MKFKLFYGWYIVFAGMSETMMKISFVLMLAVTLFLSSCGWDKPDTAMEAMFPAVPLDITSKNVLWFYNMEKIKEIAGIDMDAKELSNITDTIRDNTESQRIMDIFMAGYISSDFSGGSRLFKRKDVLGFDSFDTNQEIWVMLEDPDQSHSVSYYPFSVMKGDFDKDTIIGKLSALGYQQKNYASVDYYSINFNSYKLIENANSFSMALDLCHVMVTGSEIIAAIRDETLISILDARSGKRKSLADSRSYTRVAENLGDVLGATLLPRSKMFYGNINEDWGKLHNYDLAGIGYRIEGQDRKMVIVLHYPGWSAAGDIDELKRRMVEYTTSSLTRKDQPLPAFFDIGEPQAIFYGLDSILKIELVYKPDTQSLLWRHLADQGPGFLVSDPASVTRRRN